MGVLDIVEDGKLEHPRGATGALTATTSAGAPLAPGDGFVLGKLEEGVEEAVHHLLDDAGLNFVVESVEAEIGGGAHDVEGSVKIIGAMGEDEGSGVYEAEGEMKGGRRKGGRREVDGQGLARGRLGVPLEELGVEVGRARNENKTMRRKDGGGAFMVGGGEGAGERDANVRVEAGSPHKDEVFAKLV